MNHVNSKVVLGLGAAALAAIVAAALLSSHRKPAAETVQSGGYAVPALRDHVNEVTVVTVTAAENKPLLSLARGDRGWTVKEKGGYPADSGKLRELLLKLADASLLEPKTASEQRYPELGVEDTGVKDAKGLKLSLEGLAKPEALIVGNFNSKASGTFVRRPDDKQSWLAKGNLTVDRDPTHWLDKAIADIGSDRIAEVVLTGPSGKTLRVYKEHPGDTDFKVADLPAGKDLSSPGAANGLASTLGDLTLQDAAPAAEAKVPADGQQHKAGYRTFDGLKVDVTAWKDGDKHYARFTAVLEQAKAEAHVQETQAKAKTDFEAKQKDDPKLTPPPEVADPAKDREQRLAALASEAAGLTRRFEGWVFVIPPFKYVYMDKTMDDLVKAPAPTKPEAAKAEPAKPAAKAPEVKKPEPKKPSAGKH
ncbi:MAG: DUF4340 domain-containing protein [Methylococcaceae bacterium]|nr:DUF4340 domain-containing protein [Methylococcaceae bacterium]